MRLACLGVALGSSLFAQTYTIKPFAGGGWPAQVPALSVGLANSVTGMAADKSGNLYFSIAGFVLRMDNTGNLSRMAGDGVCRYGGDDGPAAIAGLCSPAGLAIDLAGNLYIADSGNYRVRKISNGVITTVAGSGVQGNSGNDGPATSAQLRGPYGVAVDNAGNLYISDPESSVVRKISGGTIAAFAGDGRFSYSGDGGPAKSARLDHPQAIATDSAGNLYIDDHDNNVIRKVSSGTISTVAGNYSGGTNGDNISATSAALRAAGIAVDSSGSLYISEESRARIRKVSGGVISTIAGTGVVGHAGDGGPATTAQLGNPRWLASGPNGELYVADLVSGQPGTWVRKISNGIITTVAGNGVNATGDGYIDIFGADDNSLAADALFDNPMNVAVDKSGRVYVTDVSFSVVREISNGRVHTIAGNWKYSDPLVDDAPATQGSLAAPGGVAVDADGNTYIADWDHGRVRKITNGIITTVAGGGNASGDNVAATSVKLNGPKGLAVDSTGNVYFTDGNVVRKLLGGIITTVAGNGTAGYGGDGGPANSAQLNNPRGLAVSANGDIFVADMENSRVRRISNGIITTVAGTGTAGYGGDNGPAASAQLNAPMGVAVDAAGNIYVADRDNSRVRRIANGTISTIAGNGTEGYSGDEGPAVNGQLNHPDDVAVDAGGNVYVADTGNRRVRLLVPSGSPSCTYSVNTQTLSAEDSGGKVTVNITAASGCTWTASSGASWLTDGTGTGGSGNGTVTYTAAANSSTSIRTGVLTVAGQSVYVNQAGSGQALSSLVSVASGGIVNAASGAVTIAAGSFISVFGQNLSDATGDWSSAIAGGVALPVALHGVRVRVNGKDCYVYFVSPGQINVLTPPDSAIGLVLVEVATPHGTAAAMVQMGPVSPGWFTYFAQGKAYVAALTVPDNLLAAPVDAIPGAASRPAKAGEYVQLFANGLGATNPQYPAGQVLTGAYPVADLAKIRVTVGGQSVSVVYAGMVSPGLFQVNIRVPDGIAAGDLPVVLSVDGQVSQTTASVAFK